MECSSVFCDLENNVKVKLFIWHKDLSKDNHVEKDAVVRGYYVISISCFHWKTLERSTLPYEIHKLGHCDLIRH